MIANIIENMNNYKGTYPERVKALMKNMRNSLANNFAGSESDMTEDPVMRYDYSPYCLKRRVEGTVSGIQQARTRFSDILTAEQIDTMFAFSNSLIMKGGYNYEVDRFNQLALSAAVWILDELVLSGRIEELYPHLPEIREEDYSETIFPIVKHPVYADDLIFSLVYLIRHRNSAKDMVDETTGSLVWGRAKAESDEKSQWNRSAFDSILALLDPDSVQEAVRRFEEKVWEFYRLSFSVMAAVEKRENALIRERDELQNRMSGNIAESIEQKNVLLMPSVKVNALKEVLSEGQDSERRKKEVRRLENEIEKLENVTFTCISLPNDREKLARSLKGVIPSETAESLIAFHVDDPFEAAFALFYLMDANSKIPWLYYGSISVAYTLRDQLPYDTRRELPGKPIKLTNWNSTLYQHRYKGYRFPEQGDALGEPVVREYAKNLSQIVFSNTSSLIPRVVPEQSDLEAYFNDFGEMSKREKEACSLLSYALVAGRLRPDSVQEYQALWAAQQLLEDSCEGSEPLKSLEDDDWLERENERLRSKNKELVAMVSGALASKKENSKQVHLLQRRIELQEKELSDLREAIYILKDGSESEPPADESIRYPHSTSGKIISFGGHETWLKEMRRRLPNVIFVAPSSLPNTDLICRADAVWLQTNCISHADFFRIINIVRHNGIPLRYFSFAGVDKCAEQLVRSFM